MSDTAEETHDIPRPTPPEGAGDPRTLLRSLPAVNEIVQDLDPDRLAEAPREEWVEEVRQALAELRAKILGGGVGPVVLAGLATQEALLGAALRRIQRRRDPGCVRVVNATGVVLHTNLGRAAMPPAALEALARHGAGFALLAADRETGDRAPRERHVEKLLQRLTGCEAATVVNNNAAATMIALAALAKDREVVTARGQLVEIGGAYRIPDVMRQSGAVLREVGTTNRVHLKDYENAITDETALLMRVHTSNYRVEGFSGEVSLEDLVRLAKAYGLRVMDDLGSGALVPLAAHGVPGEEPQIKASIDAGADIITASGDKLIGGPQMGILVGTRECIGAVRAHPLYRAVRCDKLTLIAMEATLRVFLDADRLADVHPTFAMLTAQRESLRERAEGLATQLASLEAVADGRLQLTVEESADAVGAGSLPTVKLPGAALRIALDGVEAGALAHRLRSAPTPLFSTVHDGFVHLHVRTLLPDEDALVAAALRHATSGS